MTTEEFITTVFFQINSELNKGATFETLHICRSRNFIGVKGSKKCKQHYLIHNFTKDEITNGITKLTWKLIIIKINKAKKKLNRKNANDNILFLEEKMLAGIVEPNLAKFFRAEINKSESVSKDVTIVNEPWNIL